MIGCFEATVIVLRLIITEWKKRRTFSVDSLEYQGRYILIYTG